MSIKAVLFDLDGTLLPMDLEVFVKTYLKLLAAKMAPMGYEPGKLVETIWAGTGAMVKNDGRCSNETRFWDVFAKAFGPESLKDKPLVDEFYSQEFHRAKDVCGFNPGARKIIDLVKASGKQAVLATNPIFPAVATGSRMGWAGLAPEDFTLVTAYENSSCCKPNPGYYIEILEKIGCAPEECVMVGNDVTEDMVAQSLGMRVFLLTDCLINKEEKDISVYPHGGYEELENFLKEIL